MLVEDLLREREDIRTADDIWDRAIPIAVHGDKVPVSRLSVDVTSWNGVLTLPLGTLDVNCLITGLVDRCTLPDTEEALWSVIVWALMALCDGTWPSVDWEGNDWPAGSDRAMKAGTPLAAGLFCVLWTLRGDMDWFQTSLHLEGASGTCICPWCRANCIESEDDVWAATFNIDPLPWNGIGPNAAWKATRWASRRAWLEPHGGRASVHTLFLLPGVSIFTVAADVLHIIDLGVTHYLLGNALFLMCFQARHFPAAATPALRLEEIWGRIVRQYRQRGTESQLSNILLSFFCKEDGPYSKPPVLKSRAKAAETKELCPIIADIFRQVHDRMDATDRAVLECLDALTEFYVILQCRSYNLPDHAQHSINRELQRLFVNYRILTLGAAATNSLMWHEVPAFHYAWHIGDQCLYMNPRFSWTYMDESFMHVVKQVTEKCMRGTASHKIAASLVQKWAFGVALRLAHEE